MRAARATLAILAAGVAAFGAVQLARVDADVGPAFGPDRVQRTLDAVPTPPAEQIAAARDVLDARPLDGRAYRTIALAQHRPGLLETANARWPRDPMTRASLTDRALAEGDVATGLQHLDALLRVAPELNATFVPLLMPHLGDARVREALADRLSENPPWRGALLTALRDPATSATDADALLAALARRAPLDDAARDTRVTVLDRAGRAAEARALWIASLPAADRDGAGQVYDGGFEHPEVQGGYGWRFDDIPGVQIDYDTVSPRTGSSALAVEFLDRAVKFAGVHQALALAPGHYRFEAAARDGVSGTRPFEWRITCDGGAIATLPIKRDDTWHLQSAAFDVPPDCKKQALVLAHTGRSLEERRLQGRLLVDDLGIFLSVTDR